MLGAMFVVSRVPNGISSSCGCINLTRIFQQKFTNKLPHLHFTKSILQNRTFCNSNFSTFARTWSEKTSNRQWNHIRLPLIRSHRTNHRLLCNLANPLIINTNVLNNVILYRFEKTLRFKLAAVFAVMTLLGCWFMVDNVYMLMCRGLFDHERDLMQRIREHTWPITAMVIGGLGGPLICITIWYLTMRSVKYVILRKGGKAVTIVTYHPVRSERTITVPVEKVSCELSRIGRGQYSAIKIKGYGFKFILEKEGHFVNPELFDSTVGVKR
ncbi:hypothetical protein QAD02_000977 [Eretmocerus hayati]|uniref:Uncharacterized protein n=1 Tax=Eretmocerus hayati TaxID=131215 RepID=A0ACC2NFL3_9HYME|nr:hypothetical protein QAD02_000977 [Eretmocerus hayati]